MKREKICLAINTLMDVAEINENQLGQNRVVSSLEVFFQTLLDDEYFKIYSKEYIRELDYYMESALREIEFIFKSSNVVLIKIREFKGNTSDRIKEFLEKNTQIDTVLFDLRNNSGGNFYEMVKTASLFIKCDTILYLLTCERIYEVEPFDVYQGTFKLYFCINQHTCSSAEIFAGILKYTLGAVGIGEKTFGKKYITKMINVGIDDVIDSVCISKYKYIFSNGKSIECGLEPNLFGDGCVKR